MTRLFALAALLLAACGSGTAPSNGNTQGNVVIVRAQCVVPDGGGPLSLPHATVSVPGYDPANGDAWTATACGPWTGSGCSESNDQCIELTPKWIVEPNPIDVVCAVSNECLADHIFFQVTD